MKASTLGWIILASVGLSSIGQVRGQDVWLGVNGGLSIPNISGGNNPVSEGYSSRLAPNFGLSYESFFDDNFSLRTEADWVGQGGKRDGYQAINQPPPGLQIPSGQYLYANFKNQTILDYLEVPVMAKYSWGRSFRFFVEAGVYAGYLLTAKTETSGNSLIYVDTQGTPLTYYGQPLPPQSFNATTDVKSSVKDWNWGATGGVGIAYPVTKGSRVSLTARFEDGIPNIQRDTADDGKNHTGAVLLTLGYEFRL